MSVCMYETVCCTYDETHMRRCGTHMMRRCDTHMRREARARRSCGMYMYVSNVRLHFGKHDRRMWQRLLSPSQSIYIQLAMAMCHASVTKTASVTAGINKGDEHNENEDDLNDSDCDDAFMSST